LAKSYRGFPFDFRRSALAGQYKRSWERLKGTSRTDAVLNAGVVLVQEFGEKRLLGLSPFAESAVDGMILANNFAPEAMIFRGRGLLPPSSAISA